MKIQGYFAAEAARCLTFQPAPKSAVVGRNGEQLAGFPTNANGVSDEITCQPNVGTVADRKWVSRPVVYLTEREAKDGTGNSRAISVIGDRLDRSRQREPGI